MYCLLKTADRGVRASLVTYLVYHTALKKASIVKPFCVTLVQLRREQAPQAGNRNLLFFCRQGRVARLKPDPSGSQPDRERQNFLHFFYFFISHEQRFTDYPISAEKGATAPFSCLPARMGSGKARIWVKGRVPCGYLGQRPKPSESFSASISAIFKVQSSLFLTRFFIDYLTLPSNFILNCGLPSSVTVIEIDASNFLPVLADLHPFNFTSSPDRNFCAIAAVKVFPMLSK